MTHPLVTIGITCHNSIDTIGRALASALEQAWPSFEVVVVDDCSTDGSAEVVAGIIAGEPRARLVKHERNKGVAAARNSIVEAANGSFVAFFDDDDVSAPDRLAAQVARIESFERRSGTRLVFCYSDRSVVEEGSTRPSHVSHGIGRSRPEPHGPEVADFLLTAESEPLASGGQCGSCTLMARRETFLAVGPFDESFRRSAEIDLAIRGAFLGAHFISVDRPLITQYKTAAPEKANIEPLRYALRLRRKHREYLGSRRRYLTSVALAHANFYAFRNQFWKGRAYRLAALMLDPRLARRELHRRVSGP